MRITHRSRPIKKEIPMSEQAAATTNTERLIFNFQAEHCDIYMAAESFGGGVEVTIDGKTYVFVSFTGTHKKEGAELVDIKLNGLIFNDETKPSHPHNLLNYYGITDDDYDAIENAIISEVRKEHKLDSLPY